MFARSSYGMVAGFVGAVGMLAAGMARAEEPVEGCSYCDEAQRPTMISAASDSFAGGTDGLPK